jgi:hypothetical protein
MNEIRLAIGTLSSQPTQLTIAARKSAAISVKVIQADARITYLAPESNLSLRTLFTDKIRHRKLARTIIGKQTAGVSVAEWHSASVGLFGSLNPFPASLERG